MSTVTKAYPTPRAATTPARTTAEDAARRSRRTGKVVAIAATAGAIATTAAVSLSIAAMRTGDLPGVVS